MGFICFRLNKTVGEFTTANIQDNDIVFVHNGDSSCGYASITVTIVFITNLWNIGIIDFK